MKRKESIQEPPVLLQAKADQPGRSASVVVVDSSLTPIFASAITAPRILFVINAVSAGLIVRVPKPRQRFNEQ
jgi:hypothetical protein